MSKPSQLKSATMTKTTVYSVVGGASKSSAKPALQMTATAKVAVPAKPAAGAKVAVLEVSIRKKNPYAIGVDATIRAAKKAGILTPAGNLASIFK